MPLFSQLDRHQDAAHTTPVWVIEFGHSGHRLCSIVVVQTETRNLRLAKIDANLPALLFGHNGHLPPNAETLYLALTRLDHLVAPLLEPSSRSRFLRLSGEMLSHCICSLEVAVQVGDPDRQLIFDSHLSQFRSFIRKPIIVPGESTTFRSDELDLKIYSKDLEFAHVHSYSDNPPATRIEAHFKASRAILSALDVTGKAETARAIPYASLLPMLARTIDKRLLGGLASPCGSPQAKPRGSTARVLKKFWSPSNLHAALHIECGKLNDSNASKLRRRVFNHFSRECPSNLPALLKQPPEQFPLVQVVLPDVERQFATTTCALQWPTTPDPAIAAAFSELRLGGKAPSPTSQ